MKKLFLLLVMVSFSISVMAIERHEEAGFIVNTEILSILDYNGWVEISKNNLRQFAYYQPRAYDAYLTVREKYDKSKRTRYQRYEVLDYASINNINSYAADGGSTDSGNGGVVAIDDRDPDKVRIECYLGRNIKVEYLATTATKEQLSKFKYEEQTSESNTTLKYDYGLDSYSDSPIFTLMVLLGKTNFIWEDGISDEEAASDYNW